MPDCPYCQEFEAGRLILGGEDHGNRILYQTEHFAVFPTLGHFTPGYLLIASRGHRIGMGSLPIGQYDELEAVQRKVRSVLREVYGPPIFFEHGSYCSNRRGGLCIDHAHIHAMPAGFDMNYEIERLYPAATRKIFNLMDLMHIHDCGEPYLFTENNAGKRHVVVPTGHTPAQYLRKLAAARLGKTELWDWAAAPMLPEMRDTFQRLSGRF
jgi:diadenosine tetraphosphate (Ap4A) HIT family hydrolase